MISVVNRQYFSKSYAESRERFCEAAEKANALLSSMAIDNDSDLTINVATLGDQETENAIVVSSGVHGVEGFMGSAIQLAWLNRLATQDQSNVRFVLIHTVNPFGMAQLRRCNEDNVDLNRNFHDDARSYSGAPARYAQFDPLLNPKSSQGRFDAFYAKAIFNVIRYGMPALKETIAGGQYEFSNGLFFGGTEPCASTRIIQSSIADWVGKSKNVVHLDFHSGLGRFARPRLLLVQSAEDPGCQWYRQTFDAEAVEPLSGGEGFAYVASGAMGAWLRNHFADRNYYFATPEFGTYSPLRVLAALRRENRSHFHNSRSSPAGQKAKKELLECFCPASAKWREQVVATGLTLIDQAVAGIVKDAS